ncbi:MAG TPA: YafY family transcriptional regulator [Bacteroidetes bacterium]|nr:YafY family transcriptional regulator [Bacteroidota bacterium]HIL57613.1 YafY family transcriptional regulator [Rhodothermales bacterium]
MPRSDRSLNKTERLFALVLLLQNRPNMTSRDLAEHFGVSRRTIFRDLRTLGESGVPLTYAEAGGYEILEGYQLPPLMFSAREAATLLVGTAFTKLQPDASLRTDADAVGMKIRSVLPDTVRDYIDRLQERTVLSPFNETQAHDATEDEQGLWFELSEAVARQRRVKMTYYVASRDEETVRLVDPLGLVYYSDHWNLIGYDHLRDDIRNFRLDRIKKLRTRFETFEAPVGFDLKEHLRERGTSPENLRMTVRFRERVWRWARRQVPADVEQELPEGDGWIRVTFDFENPTYVARWLLRYGTDVEVVEPTSLRDAVRDQARAIAEQYAP